MENSLKQRIVGAVVLIGLAVIFLPSILKEKTQRKAFQSQIAEKPIDLVEMKVNEETKLKNEVVSKQLDLAEEKAKEQQIQLSNNQSVAETKALAEDNSSNLSEQLKADKKVIVPAKTDQTDFTDAAWVIQVASFSNKDNAEKLITQLKASKYTAYRRDGKNQKGQPVYRIYVGPYIEKARANKELTKISKISQSKAILLAFDPLKH